MKCASLSPTLTIYISTTRGSNVSLDVCSSISNIGHPLSDEEGFVQEITLPPVYVPSFENACMGGVEGRREKSRHFFPVGNGLIRPEMQRSFILFPFKRPEDLKIFAG